MENGRLQAIKHSGPVALQIEMASELQCYHFLGAWHQFSSCHAGNEYMVSHNFLTGFPFKLDVKQPQSAADYFFLYSERIPYSPSLLAPFSLAWEGVKRCLEAALRISRDIYHWESSREQGDNVLLAVWAKDNLELMKWTQRDRAVGVKGKCSDPLVEQHENKHSYREQDPPHNIYS